MDRPPRRHRPADQHRRPGAAAAPVPGRRALHADLRRRGLRFELARAAGVPSVQSLCGDHHRGASAGALRRTALQRRPRLEFHREAAGRRGLDQRRLHGVRAQALRLPERGPGQSRSRCPRANRRRRRAGRLPARSLLAVHGHAARRPSSRAPLAERQGSVEHLGLTIEGNRTFWRDRPTLVTGATGLLGGWLVRRLLDLEADVICLIRDWVPQSEHVSAGLIERTKVVRGDIRDQAMLERTLGEYEVDSVIHLAAQTIVGIANRNPVSTYETNVGGTWALLEACRRTPTIRQIAIASSDKAYGSHDQLPYDEGAALQGRHPSGVSRSAADRLAQSYAPTFRLPVATA